MRDFVTRKGRKFWIFENRSLRLLVAPGGGHIAALHGRRGGRLLPNPLWEPPWKSMEPMAYRPAVHDAAYGGPPEGRLLAGLLGHNLALDTFGTPSAAETFAGMTTHGEAGVLEWKRRGAASFSVRLPEARLEVRRRIEFVQEKPMVVVETTVRNLAPLDRPLCWAEHVTFGPPFLSEKTVVDMPAGQAMVYPADFGADSLLEPGREFTWPTAPGRKGKTLDWRRPPGARRATDFTAQLLDTSRAVVWFTAVNRAMDLSVGYVFRRLDFPWLGIWDEKFARTTPPWRGRTWSRGMEFSTTPFPMSRRGAIEMNRLFGIPTYRWLDARGTLTVPMVIFVGRASEPALLLEAGKLLS